MPTRKKKQLLYLEWIDHASDSGWGTSSEIKLTPCRCATVGFLIKEDKNYFVLASCVETDFSHINMRHYVLKNCVTKKKVLKIP